MSMRKLVLGVAAFALVLVLIHPSVHQQVEAKKLKEKKALKSLVRGLIFKNLSTKKNFLPLPIPIPGKWQSILDTLVDTRTSSNKKVSNANTLQHLSKLDIDELKKFTRLYAAKFSQNIIGPHISSSSSSPINNNSNKKHSALTKPIKNKITKALGAQTIKDQPDYLVTMFNIVKLAQQIKELDRSKIIDVAKKSSSTNKIPQPTLLSMNINNKKSFINKMNYIHKLTTDFNHRHLSKKSAMSFLF